MNIHEYQGKEILKSYGVRIQEGIVAETPEQAVEAAAALTADGPLEYLEQPCATVPELAELRRRVDVPVAEVGLG